MQTRLNVSIIRMIDTNLAEAEIVLSWGLFIIWEELFSSNCKVDLTIIAEECKPVLQEKRQLPVKSQLFR